MNNCLNCGNLVKNKFCNVSCQNTYKGKLSEIKYNKDPKLCKKCGKVIEFSKRENSYCSQSCAAQINNLGVHRHPVKEKIILEPKIKEFIKDAIKSEIFSLSKNWQSARSSIRKDAARVYKNSGLEYKCAVCNYDTYVEIAHIKAVSEFEDSSTIKEINDINNLVALCPNHHWEYDNQIIKL